MKTRYFAGLRHFLLISVAVASLGSIVHAQDNGARWTTDKVSWLDNGVIRLGVDLTLGGAITYLGPSKTGPNLINSADCGREVQMSFYSGPNPYEPNGQKPSQAWIGLGWNPIQCGDYAGNRSAILSCTNNGKEVRVTCVPMQWPLDNVPGECTFDCDFKLHDNVVDVSSALNNHRSDQTQYPAHGQELPAVYTNGPWYKLVSYIGEEPYTGASPTTIVGLSDGKGWPWVNFNATEHWTALLDSSDFGLGVWNPGTTNFSGGFSGVKGSGREQDEPTGYIAPNAIEILDHNIVYAYHYSLIVGTLEQIRKYVYANRPKSLLPNSVFTRDRQGWSVAGCTDSGWPITGSLKIDVPPGADAALVGPKGFWRADQAPTLYIRAAFKTSENSINVSFEPNIDFDVPCWGSPPPVRRPTTPLGISITGDGVARTYSVNLGSKADYTGAMDKLTISLPPGTSQIYAIGFDRKTVEGH